MVQAKQESISAIFEAAGHKVDGKAKRVIVTGCLAQRYAGELAAELPEVRGCDGLGLVRPGNSLTLSPSLRWTWWLASRSTPSCLQSSTLLWDNRLRGRSRGRACWLVLLQCPSVLSGTATG